MNKSMNEAVLRLKKLRGYDWEPVVIIAVLVLTQWLGWANWSSPIFMLGLLICFFSRQTQRKLHAIGLQLAMMHDRLNALAGVESVDHVAQELEVQP